MANAVVAVVAAGAGAFAGKLLDGKKRETSRGADDADDVDFKTDAKSQRRSRGGGEKASVPGAGVPGGGRAGLEDAG